MDLFTYLRAKKGVNTYRDTFSYLLGKSNSGIGGTYTSYNGTSLNISDTQAGKIKNLLLNSTQLTQDGTPSPDNPVKINTITGNNTIKIANSDGTKEQNYPISLSSKNLFNKDNVKLNYTWNNTPAGGRSIYFIETKPNETYTISASNWNDLYYDIVYLDHIGATTNIYESGWINPSTNPSRTFTTTAGTNILGIHFKYQSSGSTVMTQEMFDNATIQLEKGSKLTDYEPYYNIEYCKIGDYADQIFKNTTDSEFYDNTLIENEWYLKKNVDKIESYNGETITTTYISTTGGLDTGATIYYGLATPTYIHITEEDYLILKPQLDNIYNNARTYNEETNITQTNDDLPFNISLDAKVVLYEQIEYIESTGTQYLDLGRKSTPNTKFDFTFTSNKNVGDAYQNLFGSQYGTTKNRIFLQLESDNDIAVLFPQNGNLILYMRDNGYFTTNTSLDHVKVTPGLKSHFVYDLPNRSVTFNDLKCVSTGTYPLTSSNYNILVFNRNNTNGAPTTNIAVGKLYNFKWYEKNKLIMNLVPCYRKSDNEIGMYDIKNDTFYTNAGTGTFNTPISQLNSLQSINLNSINNLSPTIEIQDEEINNDELEEVENEVQENMEQQDI